MAARIAHMTSASTYIRIAELELGDEIGRGGIAVVFHARWKGATVAVRQCPCVRVGVFYVGCTCVFSACARMHVRLTQCRYVFQFGVI
jgi:hypothetical protein